MSRYRFMPWPVKIVFIGGTIAALILYVFHWFGIPVAGNLLSGTFYAFLLYAVLGFNVFMGLGATKATKMKAPPWYDYVLSFILWGIIIFMLINSQAISARMWEPPPTTLHLVLAVILGGLTLEAGRRVAGWGFVALLGVCIIYPLFADKLPGMFYGYRLSFADLMGDFAYGANGLLGLPAQIIGEVILPFFLFAGVVGALGGGPFFLKLASCIGGRFRGGPAKVAVLASGFFGSLTGSPIANIAATGSFTIPAMKRLGYPPHYAGAIEACASSGSDTMPPVLGGSIFLMIVIAGVTYADVVIAAFLPTVLYYLGLIVQVDGYAYKHGLKGMNKESIPRLWPTLKEGWLYIFAIVFLVFGLLYMRWGVITPLYTVGLVIIFLTLNWLVKKFRDRNNPELALSKSWSRARQAAEAGLAETAGLTNFGLAIFLALSFILVGLYKTGVAASITTATISLGLGNIHLILLISMVYSIIMGMVGLQRVAYLFLAVTMAPAFVTMTGINPIAIHLFLIFYAGLGGLTPPIAIYAYVAANMAGADYQKTAMTAVRMGIVLAIVPWFFVYQPAMLIIGSEPLAIIYTFILMSTGIWLLASGLEGCLIKVGALEPWERALLIVGGFLFAFPGWETTVVGGAMCAVTIAITLWKKRHRALNQAPKKIPN
ncbi:MAG: TRAP transporter fused permease subunit [Chloroflexota bacterium]